MGREGILGPPRFFDKFTPMGTFNLGPPFWARSGRRESLYYSTERYVGFL